MKEIIREEDWEDEGTLFNFKVGISVRALKETCWGQDSEGERSWISDSLYDSGVK